MAIVEQNLFSWQEVDAKSDLQRLKNMLQVIPDEKMMKVLELKRGQGRDDYPIRAIWNSILAGVIDEHKSVESLRRELKRNPGLRDLCGFDPFLGEAAVPSPRAYSEFLKKLLRDREWIEGIFDELVEQIKEVLPDYGKSLAIDSKAIQSYGKPNSKEDRDGRREKDADWGKKVNRGEREDGSVWEKITKWFGYKVHIMADSVYELPIAYEVSRASKSDQKMLRPLIEKTDHRHADLLKRAEELTGDRGYDDEDHHRLLWDKYGIKPMIDIRNMWRDGETTRLLYPERADTIGDDYEGTVFCYCQDSNKEMRYEGFEKDRQTLRYRCSRCGRRERIALEVDRRIFTPVARSSHAWKRKYKKRTAVERIVSRLDTSFGFENHFIRGQAKMEVRVGIAMVVMLSLALGSIRENQQEKMRSLVAAREPLAKAA
jgi:hypothetical protein